MKYLLVVASWTLSTGSHYSVHCGHAACNCSKCAHIIKCCYGYQCTSLLLPIASVLRKFLLAFNKNMTFLGSWRCFCLHVWEIQLTGEQPMMSYSVSLYLNTCKLLQVLFLLPHCRISWRWVTFLTLYKAVLALRNLRLAFRRLPIMHTECIHGLLFFA
jgi:hypothetical protein